ncbi:hypothetical protein [Caulobacter sp. S45]|uniref:hypothetical protein n=1 Tax=Caulobacter sp. S45 TaxID=1641861 RepID=UPI0015758FB4|nr:hypothetical protein [Caulobacter sp. S45]
MIFSGEKRQTIRLPRKRHARAGERLQLFQGMRTRSCLRLGVATCLEVRDVLLDFREDRVVLDDAVELTTYGELNAFAKRDGFAGLPAGPAPWDIMRKWWAMTHDDPEHFRGVLIGWGETFERAA